MKTLMIPVVVLFLLLLITSCTMVKRFKSADYKGVDHSLADMSLFGASLDQPLPESEGQSLWDLSADAQTQLIRIYNERYPDNTQFTAELNRLYMGDGLGFGLDFTRRKLKMVFTISKKKEYASIGESGSHYSPADRIESVKFSLEIPSEYNLQFAGWNRYSTEYGEVEIADVSFSRSIDLGADVSTKFADGSLKGSSSRKEDQALKVRYLKLNGSISPLRLEMETEGCREIDLAGNVVADVSMEFEGFPEKVVQPLYSAVNGDPFPQLSFMDVILPRLEDAPDSIMAILEMEYVYRHVESGWKTFQEWDDRVAYYSGRVRKPVLLFHKSEYLPSLYCLGVENKGSKEREEWALRVRSASGAEYPLQFLDHREARRFLDWLYGAALAPGGVDRVGLPFEIGDCSLLWGDQPLTQAMLSSMKKLGVVLVY